MRIIVNDIAASSGGAITVLKQFYSYVKQLNDDNEWIFLLGNVDLEETEHIKIKWFPNVKKSRIHKIVFDFWKGKKIIEKYKPDIVLSLQNIITFGLHVPQIVYVHQSIPFQKTYNFSFFKREERHIATIQYLIGFVIKLSIKKADLVIVQTNWMKDAVLATVNKSKNKIKVLKPEVDFFESTSSNFISKRFFYPTSNEVYKNIKLIIKACDELEKEGVEDFEIRLTLPYNFIVRKHINCIGYLSKNQIQSEYQSSTLIYPSFIETIGLPLLEARMCGAPILAANTLFAHECLQNYSNVIYFNPFQEMSLASAIKQSFSMKPQTNNLKQKNKSYSSWALLIQYMYQLAGELE